MLVEDFFCFRRATKLLFIISWDELHFLASRAKGVTFAAHGIGRP